MGILWIILIGFVAGLIARFVVPGPNNPSGFILTVVLGIAGSFLRDLYRSGDRLVSSRPGSRFHRRNCRRRPCTLYMASARRARRHF